MDIGTTPGGTEIASFEQTALVLSASGVPAGNYYVRVRSKNQSGVGPALGVLSLTVPDCSTEEPDQVTDLKATVAGNVLTLSWTPPATPPGRPITYYEIEVGTGLLEPRFLLPTTASTITAALPSGTYTVSLYAGNACGVAPGFSPLTFTVP